MGVDESSFIGLFKNDFQTACPGCKARVSFHFSTECAFTPSDMVSIIIAIMKPRLSGRGGRYSPHQYVWGETHYADLAQELFSLSSRRIFETNL